MGKPSLAAGGGAPARERDTSTLLELLSDWYWEQDAEFRFTVISRRSADTAGPDPFPYVGRKHWEQPALNLREEDWERHRAQLAWHQPFRDLELQHLTEDGRLVCVSLSGQPVFDEIGTFVGYRGVGRDITALKRAEQLRSLEHGIARCLAQAANAAREHPLRFGIGLHLGDVLYGNIGTPTRLEFTVIGAAANEAARIESLCKVLEVPLIVSAPVARHLANCRPLGRHSLRGVGDPVDLFTL